MNENKNPVVVIDDDTGTLRRLERLLRFEGYPDVLLFERADDAWPALAGIRPVAILLDLMMPGTDGFAMLGRLRAERPEIPVIVATALDDLDTVVRCMRGGAFDYVPKSAESTRLLASLEHAATIGHLMDDNRALRQSLMDGNPEDDSPFCHIITNDVKMKGIFRYLSAISRSDKAILVTGESGTGKELVADAIHAASGRPGAMVSVNIAGLDDTMFSDTLFGHKRGAFTGADSDRAGLIERAAGGTLFLDEIGDLTMQSQVKLLRLIEQRLYYPLGSDLTRSSDALIVAATNRNLEAACQAGTFRQDLYYRLQTHLVRIPPLRERLSDLHLLVPFFATRAADLFGRPVPLVPAELYDLLGTYRFPGNVRELESMVHDAVARAEGRSLSLESFRQRVFRNGGGRTGSGVPAVASADGVADHKSAGFCENLAALAVMPTIREATDHLVAEAMRRARGNQGVAAGLLGLSRTSLNRRLNHPAENLPED